MKHYYEAPNTEVILLELEETVCGVSGKGYTLKEGGSAGSFDDDSD